MIITILTWYIIWRLVFYAGTVGNPFLLILPAAISFYLIVIKEEHKTDYLNKNGD